MIQKIKAWPHLLLLGLCVVWSTQSMSQGAPSQAVCTEELKNLLVALKELEPLKKAFEDFSIPSKTFGFKQEPLSHKLSREELLSLQTMAKEASLSPQQLRESFEVFLNSSLRPDYDTAKAFVAYAAKNKLGSEKLVDEITKIQIQYSQQALPSIGFHDVSLGEQAIRPLDAFIILKIKNSPLSKELDSVYFEFFEKYPKANVEDLVLLLTLSTKHKTSAQELLSHLEKWKNITPISRKIMGFNPPTNSSVAPTLNEALALEELRLIMGQDFDAFVKQSAEFIKEGDYQRWQDLIEDLVSIVQKTTA